jgi:hypothetical protein
LFDDCNEFSRCLIASMFMIFYLFNLRIICEKKFGFPNLNFE